MEEHTNPSATTEPSPRAGAAELFVGTAARRFIDAFIRRDWSALRQLLEPDCVWSMPGTGQLSGDAIGADAVVDRARFITADGLHTELIHTLTGAFGSAVILRNTASVGGRILDEHLATVVIEHAGHIARVDTYLSDVPAKDRFFG